MKNLFLVFVVLVFFGLNACSQTKKQVPKKVKTAFAQKFQNATKVSWDSENSKEWEAEFELNGIDYSANFDLEGNWKETEHEVKMADVPDAVKSRIGEDYKNYKVKESEISKTVDGQVYEFLLKSGENKIELVLNPDGTVVKKEVLNENDDEKD